MNEYGDIYEILFSHEKEGNPAICDKMGAPEDSV